MEDIMKRPVFEKNIFTLIEKMKYQDIAQYFWQIFRTSSYQFQLLLRKISMTAINIRKIIWL